MFFKPAQLILNNLRFPAKFGLIFLIILVPIVILSVQIYLDLDKKQDIIIKQEQGIRYLQDVQALIKFIPQHRGLSQGYLKGNKPLKKQLLDLQNKIENGLAKLEKTDIELSTLWDTPRYSSNLAANWRQIKDQTFSFTPQASFQAHTHLINDIIRVIEAVADDTHLMKAEDDAIYLLTRMSVQAIPFITENMGQARGRGTGAAAAGSMPPELRAVIHSNMTTINENKIRLYKLWNKFSALKNDLSQRLETVFNTEKQQIEKFEQTLKNDLLGSEKITISPAKFFSIGTQAIDTTYNLQDEFLEGMYNYLEAQYSKFTQTMLITVSVILFTLLLVAYSFAGLYYAIMSNLSRIRIAANNLAQGDLSVNVELDSKDELADLAQSVNHIASGLQTLVGAIVNSTDDLSTASYSLSDIASRTNDAVTYQKDQLTQIATAMHELSATANEIAGNAANTATATVEANGQVSDGLSTISRSVESIQTLANNVNSASAVIDELAADSQSIGSVLDVIKGIAEQTNLLALNAAIEAARAGEQGRGFAVVADEVRTLASRTQESTQEIQTMIENLQSAAKRATASMQESQSHANNSVETVEYASTVFDGLAQSFHHISDMSTQIATAAEEQSMTVEEINRNVTASNDSINTASDDATQTSVASQQVSSLVETLKQEASHFHY